MGCCISKCKPKRALVDELNFVQDKLVISSQPNKLTHLSNKVNPLISLPRNIINNPIPNFSNNKISPIISPSSPSNSSLYSSTSATTPSTSTITSSSSSSSLSTTASSLLITSKIDRSFSNEFLRACYRDNPHILRINSIREHSLSLPTTKISHSHTSPPFKQFFSRTLAGSGSGSGSGSTPHKRVRSSSPNNTTLTRQKSSRNHYPYGPSRTGLRSPSPSRRFSSENGVGALTNPLKESCSKTRVVGPKLNATSSVSRQESFGPASPNRKASTGNRETRVHRVSSKIDETAVMDAVSSQESNTDCILIEDIDNPLISLDCFIFL